MCALPFPPLNGWRRCSESFLGPYALPELWLSFFSRPFSGRSWMPFLSAGALLAIEDSCPPLSVAPFFQLSELPRLSLLIRVLLP